MIYFNLSAQPYKNAITSNADGGYEFSCISPDENETIISALRTADQAPANQRGIVLAFITEAIVYKPRYVISQIIIEYGKYSEYPLDRLAKAIAFSRKGAAFRKDAISDFEEYFNRPDIDNMPVRNGRKIYSDAHIFVTLAELYEKEYQFEKALDTWKKAAAAGWDSGICVSNIAGILSKIDISKAVAYLEEEIAKDSAPAYLNKTLEDYKAKAAKGYVFKARARKADERDKQIQSQIKQLSYRYLKK